MATSSAGRKLPHCAFHFYVAGVSNHDDLIALRIQPRHFFVYFGNQRAGCVKHAKAALGGFCLHGFAHAVGGINEGCALRDFGQFVDKHCAFVAQSVHHEFVVDDFVAHINRRAEFFQRAFNDADGSVYACAEAARVGEHDGFFGHGGLVSCGVVCAVSGCLIRREGSLKKRGLLFQAALPCAESAPSFLWRMLSHAKSTAPTQMKLSATLNAG